MEDARGGVVETVAAFEEFFRFAGAARGTGLGSGHLAGLGDGFGGGSLEVPY
jgi:hypothetical protein